MSCVRSPRRATNTRLCVPGRNSFRPGCRPLRLEHFARTDDFGFSSSSLSVLFVVRDPRRTAGGVLDVKPNDKLPPINKLKLLPLTLSIEKSHTGLGPFHLGPFRLRLGRLPVHATLDTLLESNRFDMLRAGHD